MKNKKPIIIIASILGLALIGAVGQWLTGETPNEITVETTAPGNGSDKIDRTRAYVIGKQFAKQHLGDVSFGHADDGFEDLGQNTYLVTGVSDMPGKSSRWTIELIYKSGDWSDKKNWIEKRWFVN